MPWQLIAVRRLKGLLVYACGAPMASRLPPLCVSLDAAAAGGGAPATAIALLQRPPQAQPPP